jgi:acetaldehyde dehydrogenase (acetylating)
MTLGCGAAGGNITSDNISPLHLINLKRVAYGVRDVAAPAQPSMVNAAVAAASSRAVIERVVDQWLGAKPAGAIQLQPAVAPPLSSFQELEAEPPTQNSEKRDSKPVAFVCEEDVRSAIQSNSRIVIGKKTIITPSARELAEENDIFVTSD